MLSLPLFLTFNLAVILSVYAGGHDGQGGWGNHESSSARDFREFCSEYLHIYPYAATVTKTHTRAVPQAIATTTVTKTKTINVRPTTSLTTGVAFLLC